MHRPMARDAVAFWYFVRDGDDQHRLVALSTKPYRRPLVVRVLKALDARRHRP